MFIKNSLYYEFTLKLIINNICSFNSRSENNYVFEWTHLRATNIKCLMWKTWKSEIHSTIRYRRPLWLLNRDQERKSHGKLKCFKMKGRSVRMSGIHNLLKTTAQLGSFPQPPISFYIVIFISTIFWKVLLNYIHIHNLLERST